MMIKTSEGLFSLSFKNEITIHVNNNPGNSCSRVGKDKFGECKSLSAEVMIIHRTKGILTRDAFKDLRFSSLTQISDSEGWVPPEMIVKLMNWCRVQS